MFSPKKNATNDEDPDDTPVEAAAATKSRAASGDDSYRAGQMEAVESKQGDTGSVLGKATASKSCKVRTKTTRREKRRDPTTL